MNMRNLPIAAAIGVALLSGAASAEVSGVRIFHSCDGASGCSVQQMDLYDKADVDARLAEARGAVEKQLRELAQRVDAQQREIDQLKKRLEQR
jgi:hypothetical protein